LQHIFDCELICQFSEDIFPIQINADAETSEDQVVVGSLDINQTAVLPNELVGSRPKV
jgi:hypothetical protein